MYAFRPVGASVGAACVQLTIGAAGARVCCRRHLTRRGTASGVTWHRGNERAEPPPCAGPSGTRPLPGARAVLIREPWGNTERPEVNLHRRRS